MGEIVFRATTGVLLAAFAAVRGYYARAARGAMGADRRGGAGDRLAVGLVAASFAPLVLYALGVLPSVAALPVPVPLRWLGAVAFAAGVAVVWWAHRTLGASWSVTSGVRGGSLATGGPYAFVRHPMYSGIFLTALGAMLLTADMLAAGPYLLSVSAMYVARVRHEERALEEAFGERYQGAFASKPRLVPRPSRRS